MAAGARLLARPARRARFWQGVAALAPGAPGITAWGVVTGIAMVKGGLTTVQALGITLITMSGTTQLVAVPMLAAGVSLPLIALTAVLTGLRFPVYSAALANDLRHLPARWRWLAGFLMTDPGSAIYLNRRARERPFANRIAFYSGVNYLLWPFWLTGSFAGIFLGRSKSKSDYRQRNFNVDFRISSSWIGNYCNHYADSGNQKSTFELCKTNVRR